MFTVAGKNIFAYSSKIYCEQKLSTDIFSVDRYIFNRLNSCFLAAIVIKS